MWSSTSSMRLMKAVLQDRAKAFVKVSPSGREKPSSLVKALPYQDASGCTGPVTSRSPRRAPSSMAAVTIFSVEPGAWVPMKAAL